MLSLHFYTDGCPAGVGGAHLLVAVNQVKDQWRIFIADYKTRKGAAANMGSWQWPGPPAGVICVRLDFVRLMNIFSQIPVRSTNLKALPQPPQSRRGALQTTMQIGNTPNPRMCRALSLEDAAEALPAPAEAPPEAPPAPETEKAETFSSSSEIVGSCNSSASS